MGVSKNRDTPKWMVKIMENPMKTLANLSSFFFGKKFDRLCTFARRGSSIGSRFFEAMVTKSAVAAVVW